MTLELGVDVEGRLSSAAEYARSKSSFIRMSSAIAPSASSSPNGFVSAPSNAATALSSDARPV